MSYTIGISMFFLFVAGFMLGCYAGICMSAGAIERNSNIKRIKLGALLLLLSWNVNAVVCPEFSIEQLHTLQEAHDYGKEYNLEHTLPAIVLQESRAGEVLVGVNKGYNDYGISQINLGTASRRLGVSGSYSQGVLATKLIEDSQFNLSMAVEELEYWQGVRKDNWSQMIRSYNAGWNTSAGVGYEKAVKSKVRILDNCVNFE